MFPIYGRAVESSTVLELAELALAARWSTFSILRAHISIKPRKAGLRDSSFSSASSGSCLLESISAQLFGIAWPLQVAFHAVRV